VRGDSGLQPRIGGGDLMGKNDELAVKPDKKYLFLAEKIVDGILASKLIKSVQNGIITFVLTTRLELIEAITEAMCKNITYGNLGTMTIRDNKGVIVAKLYILPDGTLADDSWLKTRN